MSLTEIKVHTLALLYYFLGLNEWEWEMIYISNDFGLSIN